MAPPAPAAALLSLKVRLADARPPVWRRLEVAGDLTVEDLVDVLLAAMGWHNLHRHRIIVLPDGDGATDGEPGPNDEWAVPVADLLGRVGDRIDFRYDLVARWDHEVETTAVEALPPDHPGATLRDGRGPCPVDVEPGKAPTGEPRRFRVAERDAAVRAAIHLPHGRRDIARREAEIMAWFVRWVGSGRALTMSGRLTKSAVTEILVARRWTDPGHTAGAHRPVGVPEALAYPVLVLDSRARALGLVEGQADRLVATVKGRELVDDADRLAEEIVRAYPRSVLWGSAPRGWSARR
ncbi:plasmid pRiA4b ORF-3 family protein [Dietzia sp. 179-F 9C3 NHS]|uniref:plasmid pRiA4b ORF-3 family protein n=1 Tax=Dietzia sp. 179-F 9C3 NHS TaxID=3374295 RepID=UPI00387911AF